jgi:hypothetical protein
MRTIIIGASLALALLTGTAWGDEVDDSASKLMPACRSFVNHTTVPSTGPFDQGLCVGIVIGV